MTVIPLTFDPELHAYTYNGARVPSVTGVLRDAALVDYSWCTEFAMWRGSSVHEAIHVELSVGLDWSSVPEVFHPYICAARQYIDDNEAEIVECERRVVSATYLYAGTLDAILRLPNGRLRLIDWKTGPFVRAIALQLAGYANAYFEETRTHVQERESVHLRPDGSYTTKQCDDRTDRDRFLAALTVANLRREYGLLKGEAA